MIDDSIVIPCEDRWNEPPNISGLALLINRGFAIPITTRYLEDFLDV